MVNANDWSFFSNPGGINAESIRKTITLARKSAAKRRAARLMLMQRQEHLCHDAGENDINHHFSNIPDNCPKDALDIAGDERPIKLVNEMQSELTRRRKCVYAGDDNQGSAERFQPIMTQEKGKADNNKESAKLGDLLQRVISENFINVECDRKSRFQRSLLPDQCGGVKRVVFAGKMRQGHSIMGEPLELLPLTLFKARPLPVSIWVENDIFASTEAARGKDKRLHYNSAAIDAAKVAERRTQGLNESLKIRNRRDPSASPSTTSDSHRSSRITYQLKRQCSVNSAASSFEAASFHAYSQSLSPKAHQLFGVDQRERALKNDIVRLNCLMKKAKDFCCCSPLREKQASAWSEGEGEISLEREVAKLEKHLARRKNLTFEIKQFLNIDGSNNDGKKDSPDAWSTSSGEKINKLQSQSNGICESFFQCDTSSAVGRHHKDPGSALYKRQEEWLEAKEKRLQEHRVTQVMESMVGFTGVPQLSNVSGAWGRTKMAHHLAVKKQQEEEKRREIEKKARSQYVDLHKGKEIKELHAEAEKRKSIQIEKVDREKQQEALEKLAQPRVGLKPAVKEVGKKGDVLTVSALDFGARTGSKASRKRNLKRRPGKDKLRSSTQMSYADMDDREFAQLMKSIGIDMNTQKPDRRRDVS